jgi:hypothetical protein
MIRAINLKADIPENRELHLTLPADVPAGPAELLLVVSSPTKTGTMGEFLQSEFFGMWSTRNDIEDSEQFARLLRAEGWKRPA